MHQCSPAITHHICNPSHHPHTEQRSSRGAISIPGATEAAPLHSPVLCCGRGHGVCMPQHGRAWCLQSQHGRAWLAAQHAVEPFPDSVLLSTALAPCRVPRLTRLRLSCDVSAWEVQKGYTYTKQWCSVLFSTTLENVFWRGINCS